jgi:hypothetical protein
MRRAAALALALVLAVAGPAAAGAAGSGAPSPVPLLAHYYIWFTPTSWDRAKRDYPLLGRYGSDEQRIMRTHVRWAKAAGIDGFLVSWKDTPALDRRLARLIEVADAERFRLGIVLQALDFQRRPRPADAIASDLDLFARRFARARPFRLAGRPVVVWSGTWKYRPGEIARVARRARRSMLLLASEKHPRDYARIARHVDGDLYYWSSVDPARHAGHRAKLRAMARAVRARDGMWIAPAAPGFDARMVGGRSVVPRRDGATLRAELDAAAASQPDAIGLISWNEFSENTHVEPSRAYGRTALEVLADVRGARPAAVADVAAVDSSDPGPRDSSSTAVPVTGGVLALAALVIALAAHRLRRHPRGRR